MKNNIKIAKELIKLAKDIVSDYQLSPENGRKSFYGKAVIKIDEQGRQVLYSYGTPVLRKEKDGTYTRLWNDWSATTGNHIRSWSGINKQVWDEMPVQQF